MTQVGDSIGGDLPEMRIEHLERDVTVVTDSPQVFDDRAELEVSLSRQDPVGVTGELARGAADVAYLHPRQVVRRQVGQVLELTWTGVVMEHVEADAGVGRPPIERSGDRGLEAGADGRRLLKLERDPHAERRGQIGGFAERRAPRERIPRCPAGARNRE